MGAVPSRPRLIRSQAAPEQQPQQKKEAGHSVPAGSMLAEAPLDPEIEAFQRHQAAVSRLTLAEEARTLVAGGSFGVISTLSASDPAGFPSGSVVEFAPDAVGRPIFAFSSLSSHTGDLRTDGRCSFTVMAQGFKGLQDARVSLVGHAAPVPADEAAAARALYLARHPNSFWVDFGDFTWFRMDEVLAARVIGGFARAGKVAGGDYAAAAPDPVAPFSAPVCGHMNADHSDSTLAMIKHYVGITVDSAELLSIDQLGANVACRRQGQSFKLRLPFPRPATDRKTVKDVIVEMTRAAAGAGVAAQNSS
jgi:putative heme iron utilization protein